MDILKEFPIGFGMTLAQNPEALKRFGILPEARQRELLNKARSARSKSDMADIINSIL